MAAPQPTEAASPAGTWASDLQLPGLGGNKFMLFKVPDLWYLVMEP